MCDISAIRKPFVLILLIFLENVVGTPQLDLPQYQHTTARSFPSSTSNYNYNNQNNYNQNYARDRYDVQNPPNFQGRSYDNSQNVNYNRDGSNRFGSNPQSFPQNPVDDRFHGEDGKSFKGDIRELLQALDTQASQQCTNNVAAQWNFETNVNQATQLEALHAQQIYSDFQHGVWDLLNHVGNLNGIDPQIYRQVRYYSVVGPAALSPDQLDRYNRLINDMLAIYNTASVCALNEPFHCGLRLQPDLTKIMAKSRNWEELQHAWIEWRRNSGLKIKDSFEQMIHISNAAAKLNNFTNTAEYWSFPFETPALELDLEEAWEEIKPLYEMLHAYVRRRLREYYGPERINRQAPLPSHILGNMWAQSWTNIFDITQPYPGQHFLDVTPEMLRQGFTPVDMFRLAEDFFVSLNMTSLPLDFWQGSIIEEPLEKVVLCQPSAWDFCNRRDFRIKMCSKVTMKDLITVHHEMAHVHYFMKYKNEPKVFRDGANPAFHEAIGEAIGLSVGTPKHLQALGLVQASVNELPVDINYLYSMALDKVVFLPFAFVMDKWRYDIFKGHILKDEYNCHWHRLREQYQGLKPPILRSETDFDPGSKYHVPANIPYLRYLSQTEQVVFENSGSKYLVHEKVSESDTEPKVKNAASALSKAKLIQANQYFVSTLLQFQIYRSLCIAAGQYSPSDYTKPLHKCDIYRSKEAGRILMQLMEKGSSQPWRDVLFQATGESRLDGSALREYFRPLEDWLRNENLRTGEFTGWLYDGDYCKQSIETAGLQVYGGFYNSAQSVALSVWTVFILLVVGGLIR